MKGVVTSVQRFCLQDGPGIRTTVFFKGCPLKCLWCSNPENQISGSQLALIDDICFSEACIDCVLVCKDKVIRKTKYGITFRHKRCSLCEECIRVCPKSNLKIIGQILTPNELILEVLKDKDFYFHSRGGVTLSGGEPLFQFHFCYEFLKKCKEHYLHTIVDTSGAVEWETIGTAEKYTDIFFVDLKHVDNHIHQKYVGANNQVIIKNIEKMSNEFPPEKVVLRIPFIPTVNTDNASIEKIAKFIKKLNVPWKIQLLPYHCLAERKYRLMGRQYPMKKVRCSTKEEIEREAELYRHLDIDVEVVM